MLKNYVTPKGGINSNSFDTFLEISFDVSPKKMAKIENIFKNQKIWAWFWVKKWNKSLLWF